MSTVVALGGAGAMGAVSARMLAATPGVDELVVADLDVRRAAALADELGPVARPAGVDLTDPDALAALLGPADLVLNTTGPYFRFGTTVLRAAIDAGADYLDVCDDPAPTLDMLDLDGAARAAGVTAVLGMGASPGVTNLLARLAADRLDEVHDIVTGWPEDPAGDVGDPARGPSAALVHWVAQFALPGPALTDGELADTAPLQRLELDYPGAGPGPVWTVGHPEAVTLHRAYPGLRRARNVMVISERVAAELARSAATVERGASVTDAARALHTAFAAMEPSAARAPFAWLFALATGTVEGHPARVAAGLTAYPPGGMAGITGTPLGVAAGMLLDGSVSRPGVHPPETAVPATEFVAQFAPHCAGSPPAQDLVSIVAESP